MKCEAGQTNKAAGKTRKEGHNSRKRFPLGYVKGVTLELLHNFAPHSQSHSYRNVGKILSLY